MKTRIVINRLIVYSCILICLCCRTHHKLPQQSDIKLPDTLFKNFSTWQTTYSPRSFFFKDSTLVALIDEAIKNNPDMQIAIQRIEMDRSYLMLSKGAYLPYISADISVGNNKLGEYTQDGVGNFDSNLSGNVPDDKKIPSPLPDYFLGLKSSWEIDIWGKLRNLRKAAYARYIASEKGKHWVTTSLVAQVATLYYTLIALDQELEIVKKNVELQKKVVETITELKEVGMTNELALKQSAGQYLHTQFMEMQIKQKIAETENEINNLLGRYPQPVPRQRIKDTADFNQSMFTNINIDMLLQRPDVQQAEWELRGSEKELRAARAAFLRSINITALSGYNAFALAPLFEPGSFIYGFLSALPLPILQGKRIKAYLKNSVAKNYEAFYNYQKIILEAAKEVQINLQKIESFSKGTELKEKEVALLNEGVSASDYLFKAGYASYLEVIIAQKNVLEAEIQLINIRKEKNLAIINLYRSLGGGWR